MEDRQQPGGSSQLTSSQIQASIDQISHLQRILVGDDNLTLDELLAATAANDSAQGMPPGGLSEALPALLGPLLPLGIGGQAQTNGTDSFNLGSLTQKQTHLLLARRAAFVPQQYLAMAREIVERTTKGQGSASEAIVFGQQLQRRLEESQPDPGARLREMVLQNRKRRREAQSLDGNGTVLEQQIALQQQLVQTSSKVSEDVSPRPPPATFWFAGEKQARKEHLASDIAVEPEQSAIRNYLSRWHKLLGEVDVDASLATQVSLDGISKYAAGWQATIRMDIAYFGTAWVTVLIEADKDAKQETERSSTIRVIRLNARAESELFGVVSLEQGAENALTESDTSLIASAFPVYRRLTSILQSKAVGIKSDGTWRPLTAALFAMAALSHLHELGGMYDGAMNGANGIHVPRGQVAIFEALERWCPNKVDELEEVAEQDASAMALEDPTHASADGESALFGDENEG